MTLDTSTIPQAELTKLMLNGQGFTAVSALITGANTTYYGMSVFNPSNSGKSILITRFVVVIQAASTNFSAFFTTTDPALTTALTPLNLKRGGATSVASVTVNAGTDNVASLPASGKFRETVAVAGYECDLLKNGTVLLLPTGSANGASLYLYNPGASDKFSFFADWIEF